MNAILDLEPMVCDATLMAGIASTLIDDALQKGEGLRKEFCGGRKDCFYIGSQQLEQLLFAVFHAQHLCEQLKAAYYAALKS